MAGRFSETLVTTIWRHVGDRFSPEMVVSVVREMGPRLFLRNLGW